MNNLDITYVHLYILELYLPFYWIQNGFSNVFWNKEFRIIKWKIQWTNKYNN